MTKLVRATEVRDTALRLLASAGTWGEMRRQDGSVVRHLEYRCGGISMIYRTPFQKVFSEPSDNTKYEAALLGVDCKTNLPYGLDIWAERKVMNIEWDERGRVDLVSFKRGQWEQDLDAFAETLSPSTVATSTPA